MLLTPSMHTSRVAVALGAQQLVQVVGVLEAEAPDGGAAGAGDLAAVVDRLVRPRVEEDRADAASSGITDMWMCVMLSAARASPLSRAERSGCCSICS